MQKGFCRHHNGSWHNKVCRAGVAYADVTPNPELPGSVLREPCRKEVDAHRAAVLEKYGPAGTCSKYEEPTDAEIAQAEAEIQEAIDEVDKLLPVILETKKQHQGKAWAGVVACPICGGKLHLSHAACNGHVWGHCETPDCARWME